MNYNKFFLTLIIFLLVFPITFANAVMEFIHEDKMNNGGSLFFLVELEKDDDFEVKLEAYHDGYFHLYLFDKRPTETHVNYDNTIDKGIYENKIAHDSGKNPKINYTAEDDQIYYLQIILTKNGPDLFHLEANKKLSRYYLPQIPGYPLEIICILITFSIGIIIVSLNKNKLKIRK
jgi:hypothetical protein